MRNLKILVTGGAGFIGSHLCEKLLLLGNEVICIDNFYTGREDNIRHLFLNPNFKFIKKDIMEEMDVECDQIYHLACPASPIHYQHDAIKTGKICVIGAIRILELAKRHHARILQASTSEVYGNPEIHPQPENYYGCVNPIGIRACYDEGKRMAETFFLDYHRQYGVDIKVVRIFNTYGPHMRIDDGRVISNFVVQALRGEDITIYGDGRQTRSFCYVDDLVDGLICMMNSRDGVTGPINLGNPEEVTILEAAEKIIRTTKSKSAIRYLPLPEDDPIQRKPAINLAEQELKWKPRVPLEEGLACTADFFRKALKMERRWGRGG